MTFKLLTRQVGPWPMNTYLVVCEQTGASAVVDPGADAQEIVELADGTRIERILVTHGHEDHIGALAEIRALTGAPVCMHPAEAEHFGLDFECPVLDGERIVVGNTSLRAVHTPGHTPGMICFDLGDGRVLVGDALFVGGPGKTWSVEDFSMTMRSMQEIIFTWPETTRFYPGHGPSGVIGDERPAFDAFVARGWPADLHGDVTWA